MGGKVKRSQGYASRGYFGFHINWENKKLFLRSKLEYIYASYLDSIKQKYSTEDNIYLINDKSYKPDFFLYDNNNNLIKIVEVKDRELYAEEYRTQFSKYFFSISIPYEVLVVTKKFAMEKNIDVENWIQKSIQNKNSNYRGVNNPRYGMKCSDETKRKISEKAKERLKNQEFKNKQIYNFTKRLYTDEGIKKHIEMCKNREKNKRLSRINEYYHTCAICGDKFFINPSNTNKTCSKDCSSILKSKNANKIIREDLKYTRYRQKLINSINLIIKNLNISIDDFFENINIYSVKAKDQQIIYKTFGLTLNTLNKYRITKEIFNGKIN